MSRRIVSLAVVVLGLLPSGGTGGDGAGSANPCPVDPATNKVTCSLYGSPQPPPPKHGTSPVSCDSWEIADSADYALSGFQVSQIINGVIQNLYSRLCADNGQTGVQNTWIPNLTGAQLGAEASDRVEKLLPSPEIELSRPADNLIVNVETAIGVTPIDPVVATVTIPGRSATATATPLRIDVTTGSRVTTDVQRLTCRVWGGPGSNCLWTPIYPSVVKVTGTNDHRHHGSVSVVWEVTWTSTDGTSGTSGNLTTTTPIEFAVREIQIIGGG